MFNGRESDEDVLEAMANMHSFIHSFIHSSQWRRGNVKGEEEGVNGLKSSAGLRVTKCLSNEGSDENVEHMEH